MTSRRATAQMMLVGICELSPKGSSYIVGSFGMTERASFAVTLISQWSVRRCLGHSTSVWQLVEPRLVEAYGEGLNRPACLRLHERDDS